MRRTGTKRNGLGCVPCGLGLLVASVAGCAADDVEGPAGVVQRITADTAGDPIVVDLRDMDRAWAFDPRDGALPLDRVLLFCPNGATMRLTSWVSAQEDSIGVELGDRTRAAFTIGAREDLASWAFDELVQDLDDCQKRCYACPDGAYICASTCNEDDVWNRDGTSDPDSDGTGEAEDGRYGDGSWVGQGQEPSQPPPQYDPRDPPAPSF